MLLAPLELRTASQHLADRFVTAIALGEFVPGQRLPSERALAGMLNVSRKTVREALHLIARDGYVDIQRGRNGGAVVCASWLPSSVVSIRRAFAENWKALEWILDLRQLIEPVIARTAAERRDQTDLTRINEAVRAYANAADREASRAADAAIHTAIADATHNPYLANLSRQIRTHVSLGFQAEPYTEAIRDKAIVQHGQLAASIVRGDPDAATRVAMEHFLLTENALRDLARRVAEAGGDAFSFA
jgi:GntR family transcriptional repressor for pyruvate dehydrogenase complex